MKFDVLTGIFLSGFVLQACTDASVRFPVEPAAQASVEGLSIVRLDRSNISAF